MTDTAGTGHEAARQQGRREGIEEATRWLYERAAMYAADGGDDPALCCAAPDTLEAAADMLPRQLLPVEKGATDE